MVSPTPSPPVLRRGRGVGESPGCRSGSVPDEKKAVSIAIARFQPFSGATCSSLFRAVPFRILVPDASFPLISWRSATYRCPFRFVPPRISFCYGPPLLLLLFVRIDSQVPAGVTECTPPVYCSGHFSGRFPGLPSAAADGFQWILPASSFPAFVNTQPSRFERSANLYSLSRSSVRAVMLTCACP